MKMREIKTENYWIRQQDNLEFMRELEDESIDLIYCDILYGTSRNFGDYKDLKADRNIIEEFYMPRLKEVYRLLKNTSSIYIQCDWRINHWIRCLMDDVFGYGNFRNEIIWHYSKMNAVNNKFISNHDTIFMYSKSKDYTFNIQYNNSESALKQRLNRFIKNDVIIYKDVKTHKSQLINNYINSAKNKLNKEHLEDEDIVLDFKNKSKQKLDDVWNISIIKGNAKENVSYQTQKPKALLERIIKASSNEGDVVADFFMGSCTTGEVALELGRKFIGCDIGDKAFEVSKKRLKGVD